MKAAFLVGALALFLLMTFTLQQSFTRHGFGGADLVPLWLGGRALIFERISPYSPVVTARSQKMVAGATSAEGDQFAFAYPLIALLPLMPLFLLPFDWAQAAWLAASMSIVVLSVLALVRWPRTWSAMLCAFAALAFYPSVRVLALGQFAPLVLGCVALALVAVRAGHDALAGAALAFACAKPQMSILIAGAMLWWAWRTQRHTLIRSFFVTSAALIALALWWWPTWIGEWLARLNEYSAYVAQRAPLESLLGEWAPVGALALLAAALALIVFRLQREADIARWLLWLVPLSLLMAPRSSVSDQVLLLVPGALAFAELRSAGRILLAASAVSLPWLWFAWTQTNGREAAAMVWPLPIISLGVVLWHSLIAARSSSR